MAGFCHRRCVRLNRPGDFRRVFQNPCKAVGPTLTILSAPNSLDRARLGFAISKQKIRTASARNRIKRLVRESFRHHSAMLSGLDVVVLSRVGADRTDNRQLLDQLHRQWQVLAKKCKDS